MADPIKPALEAAAQVAETVSGPGTPDSISVVQRQDRLSVWVKGLSGPAVSLMVCAFVLVIADWMPFIGKLGIWTADNEDVRAKGVVGITMILTACIAVVLWVAHVGRPSRTEISAGPASIRIEQGEGE